ncbi:MAG: hypothetical protein ABI868_23475 [Acidobacteriota bacterium]
MLPADPRDTGDPLGRIGRMIEYYRVEKQSRLNRREIWRWRKIEGREALIRREKPLDRVH